MTTYSRLLLNDGNSSLLLTDDVSVLLLDATVAQLDPDTAPFRRSYSLDSTAAYSQDARHTYRSR